MAEPELTPPLQLLLLFSRMNLSDAQRARAVGLIEKVDDWDELAKTSAEHFVAPLVLRHLSKFPSSPDIERARKVLTPLVRGMSLHILQMASLQRRFVKQHVAPLGCPFAVIKGRALAARYYPDPNLRYARDLDVLLPVEKIPALILSAQQAGYRVYPEYHWLNPGQARVVSRLAPVTTLLGPDNIFVEIHAQLDKAGFLLDHRAMLGRCKRTDIDGVNVGVLDTMDHFVFICLHHTKHFWSRLNWVADLDALMSAPDFDPEKAMALARSTGVERTIRACFAFYEACGSDDPVAALRDDSEASDLLKACLLILGGGTDTEFEMRPDRLSFDFNFEWQFPPGFWIQERMRKLRRGLRPSLRDYDALSLPPSLYWVYFLLKPALVLRRRLFG